MTAKKMRVAALFLITVGVSAFVRASEPEIRGVIVNQRWPWSRLVDIDYVLVCDSTQQWDVAISAYNGQTPLSLPMASLSGDLYAVGEGPRRIVWDPTVTAYTNVHTLKDFHVKLEAKPVPLYMVIDLDNMSEGVAPLEYVYEADLVTNKWGSWERDPVTNRGVAVESVIWTGVTNGTAYKTGKLVMRYIPAGTYKKGDALVPTEMAAPYYIGVFELTEAQWRRITGEGDASSTMPKSATYHSLRGAETDDPPVDWPSTGAYVAPGSFIDRIRQMTGIRGFDLPDGDQWEHAHRAGTDTYFHDGSAEASVERNDIVEQDNNGYTNKYLQAVGWYGYDDGSKHAVGQKVPNAWGLYDSHGNLSELCLPWYGGDYRMKRGGEHDLNAYQCRAGQIFGSTPSTFYSRVGLRLVINITDK